MCAGAQHRHLSASATARSHWSGPGRREGLRCPSTKQRRTSSESDGWSQFRFGAFFGGRTGQGGEAM
jgi:hypothetical protein